MNILMEQVSHLSSREISPKPLGLYDMGLSGSEWTNDWYAADYYSHSPVNDPQGPAQGPKKSCVECWRRQTVRFNHVQAIKIASSEDR
jgi:formylglycine-generating enzyme required for sulfatase activity